MDIENIALKLQETTDRSVRNEGRIKKLEGEHDVLHQLATSVAVMAEKMDTMSKNVGTLSDKVDTLESEPAKKWRFVVETAICIVVTAVATYVLTKIGL